MTDKLTDSDRQRTHTSKGKEVMRARKYDFVAIVEVPKDDDIMAIPLCLGSMGNIHTTKMKAGTESEPTKIISAPHP